MIHPYFFSWILYKMHDSGLGLQTNSELMIRISKQIFGKHRLSGSANLIGFGLVIGLGSIVIRALFSSTFCNRFYSFWFVISDEKSSEH